MKIKWIGLSCFLVVSDDGTRIVMDPFTPNFYGRNYGSIDETADIVTISHHHADHDCASIIKGNPVVFAQVGTFSSNSIEITGIKSYHDAVGGWERGDNTIFCLDIDGMRVCHLGDLGHLLTDEQLAVMGHIDILIVPAGGKATLDPADAKVTVNVVEPKVAIPVHFNTGRLTLPYKTGDLITLWPDIKKIGSPEMEVSKKTLPKKPTVMLLKEAL